MSVRWRLRNRCVPEEKTGEEKEKSGEEEEEDEDEEEEKFEGKEEEEERSPCKKIMSPE